MEEVITIGLDIAKQVFHAHCHFVKRTEVESLERQPSRIAYSAPTSASSSGRFNLGISGTAPAASPDERGR